MTVNAFPSVEIWNRVQTRIITFRRVNINGKMRNVRVIHAVREKNGRHSLSKQTEKSEKGGGEGEEQYYFIFIVATAYCDGIKNLFVV
jgi:hypothetical protein